MAEFPDIGLFFPPDEKQIYFFFNWLQLHSSNDKMNLWWSVIYTKKTCLV